MINPNRKQLSRLSEIIYDRLDPLIDGDYVLLDIPDHQNIGDQAIWAGELAYLSRLPHKLKYSAPYYNVDMKKIDKDDIILFHGGGNFGDVWDVCQKLRENVISHCRENKIIVFPQTVYFQSQQNLEKSAEIFNAHGNVTICARDQVSYGILNKYFTKCQILLLPDMAFCLNLDNFIQEEKSGKTLFVKRTDKELNIEVDYHEVTEVENVTVSDWPSFEKEFKQLIKYNPNFSAFGFREFLFKVANRMPIFMPLYCQPIEKIENRREFYMELGINFLNHYDTIYTTRLHCFILGILLGKIVYIYDNSYGKNASFYQTWLQDFEQCYLLNESK
ncbi:polysaccharide pyruvyl transferase [Gallibacterium anatis]|uniref:polysaccharide pyruvyl transferase family protein n=1 Tax=Gallibacterium anatis TaxID=750 RepID=UPI0005322432|nr:polysaccharide pyruvyl transferase family protein [Gallibacterium anatis]KGQ41211.1 polysaccharide pyruvyl transferase [Gallibacterium anatis]